MTEEQFIKARGVQMNLYTLLTAKNAILDIKKAIESPESHRLLTVDIVNLIGGFGKERLTKAIDWLLESQKDYEQELNEEFREI